ncbi:rhomboid family intramembrane serine protease [Streptomyces albus subsp. chlorinus]|uniref:rhomboid family intramembrane serine protease n=1 Tax=Streptomyces albus TaxID=1888 RepID=UPI00156FF47B|nr:rhomboid family intramembrane serine protease [Streptomyces albus]NSC21248.1 rhomboid family intramembrane serine protease [Streptomyces albus subsp. chlorinus]
MDGTDRADAAPRSPGAGARPLVTYGLIGCCCLVFVTGPACGLSFGGHPYGTGRALEAAQAAYFQRWGVVPRALLSGGARPLLAPLTALFLHGNWLHLLGNLLFLGVFGGRVEQRMGPVRFALFYLGTGYAAMCCYALAHPGSGETLVGASGAVSAVLGAFLRLSPHTRVTSLFPFLLFLPLRFPAWVVLLFWLALQWLAARQDSGGPGVAHLAHVAGFTLGFLHTWLCYRRARVTGPTPAREGETQP